MLFYPSVAILAASFFFHSSLKAEQLSASSPQLCVSENADLFTIMSRLSRKEIKPYELPLCSRADVASETTNLSEWLARKLRLEAAPIIVWNQDELRFVPHTLNGSNLLLVMDHLSLSSKQLNKVAAVLHVKQVSVNLLWLGSQPAPKILANFVKQAKGRIWDSTSKKLTNECCQHDPEISEKSEVLVKAI